MADGHGTLLASGRWQPEQSVAASSTLLELKAATNGLKSFNRHGELDNQVVMIILSSTTSR
jgi:hypothetical protein